MTEENVENETVNDQSGEEKTEVIVVGDDSEIKDKLVEVLEKEDIEPILDQTEETKPVNKEQIVKKKEVVLPPMGSKFMIAGNSYKVTYINEGKHRFSAEPCDGQY